MITPIRNRKVVEDFMNLPEIYRYAVECGNGTRKQFTSDREGEFWLGFYEESELSGIISVHIETGSMAIFHLYILRAHKESYGKMAALFFAWMKENMQPELLKLNAYIPTIFKNTISIAKDYGMTLEGLDTLSYRHKGGVCDRVLMGIKMADIKL